MRRRVSRTGLIVGIAAVGALFLTVTKPSPEGLISLGVGDREVRAAPGTSSASVESKHNLTKLSIVNSTLIKIRDSYVEPTRIDPKAMLYAALDSVQFNIPEVLVETDRDSDRITVVVNDKKQVFSAADVDSPWRLSKKLKAVFRFIESHMNPGADLAEVEYAAVNGMLSTLDPHSVLLDPEMAREMEVSTGGEFGGLGIVIGMRDKKLTVIRPMPGTPASEAGIKARDEIVRIDDEVTENLTLQESVDRMRGKPGTKVSIWVTRDDSESPQRFDLVRDIIKVESVTSQLLGKNVGYIKIDQFAGRTADEVSKAMEELEKKGAEAWVLDLRRNPGGLLEQAIQVADLFLARGTIVTTVGGREREPRRATRDGSHTRHPIAVLVNSNSASASEIVAGALKNLDRAVIIGSATFGKGSVQILYDMDDGSKLKLTIAEYLTPGDLSIQSFGITPDIALHRMFVPDENVDAGDFVRLMPGRSFREKDLKAHLQSQYAKAGPKAIAELSFVYDRDADADADADADEVTDPDELEVEEPEPSEGFTPDFEIELARDLLAKIGKTDRDAFLAAIPRAIEQRAAIETEELERKLGKLGVDWSAPVGREAAAKLEASFTIKDHAGTLRAGETVALVGTVTNRGSTPAYRVHARVNADDRSFDGTELVFGKIDPGQSRTWVSHVKVPDAATDRLDYLEFEIHEARGAKIAAAPLRVRIEAAERPVFSYAHQLVDRGNGDGLVQPGEKYSLRVTVKNTGAGIAKDTTAILRNASGVSLSLAKARFELGELSPGEEKTVEFAFATAARMDEDAAVIEMTVYDRVLGESVSEKLEYPVETASAGPAKASGAVVVRQGTAPVFEGARDDSAQIGSAASGTVFSVTGKQGAWYRVRLGKGRPGFVRARDVEKSRTRPKLAGFRELWQVTPPSLEVALPSYETTSGAYRLSGKALDDDKIEDVYIFVSNSEAKIDNRKVFYKSNRGGTAAAAMSFATDIPLWPGTNAVTIIARENDAVRSARTVHLYRKSAAAVQAAVP